MYMLLLIASGAPVVAGIGLVGGALLARLDSARHHTVVLGGDWAAVVRSDRTRAKWAAAVALAGWLLPIALGAATLGLFEWWPDTLPLAAGIIAVAVTAVATRSERAHRHGALPVVDFRRRSAFSIAAPSAIAGAATAFIAVVVTVVAAGVVSSPDELGRYTEFTMAVGDGSAGTLFFGWYFGVPVLIGAVVLVALTWAGLARVARPPLVADERSGDEWLRRQRASDLLRTATAALCVTLGSSWTMIAGASQLRTSLRGTEAGTIEFGTSFAAVGSVLGPAALLVTGVGVALLVAILLRRRPRQRQDLIEHEAAAARA
ncbi:hypothetical protein [Curtobacterium sp. PhB115]|uniref:hypothetical protein n=1 Tax=Curtobacterium sp. PhB115 TaxID=2485173 RepID=UPI000F4BD1C2|nr:hypothetical protein [Curtobacterium sp. PhB115]ROP74521.1 hypothetical protein EDF19_0606 [Curtobacterium sp. PhB115]